MQFQQNLMVLQLPNIFLLPKLFPFNTGAKRSSLSHRSPIGTTSLCLPCILLNLCYPSLAQLLFVQLLIYHLYGIVIFDRIGTIYSHLLQTSLLILNIGVFCLKKSWLIVSSCFLFIVIVEILIIICERTKRTRSLSRDKNFEKNTKTPLFPPNRKTCVFRVFFVCDSGKT